MNNNEMDKSLNRKITIKTPQGEVEVIWPQHQQPGFCPHCHKCIPLSSIVLKKMNGNNTETYLGSEMTKKFDIIMEQDNKHQGQIGKCPYCHKAIPVREVIFKKTNEQKR